MWYGSSVDQTRRVRAELSAEPKIQLQRSRVELNELVRHTLDDHRSLFEEGGVEVKLEISASPVHVWGDGKRLAQVVGNLLQNAAKFTPREGRVTVSVSAAPSAGGATLEVADTGEGLTPDALEHLFQPFMQAEQTLDRSKGGLGLGLALVKSMVELHGGTVSATSPGPGRGATFIVRLPVDRAQEPTSGRSAARAKSSAGRRVLVVEDNRDAADSLREVLALDGHVVEVAYDGRECIARAREFRPEVVLCDIGLPEMNGFEVARTLRGDPTLSGVVLVALSGYALPEDLQKAREAGFDRHLPKPPDLEALDGLLAELSAGVDESP